ncbi:hypothetical protein Hypma_004244 [Hypsizygus marmoreus]|uniref:Uncharacterized protein n=1 Tax=Hypsizygus marmoreus TaxID=39966 RepID=A0A369J313_HYPMA|nr:hypothetical protein Hypma_004244 [Hypsizygus marmoreus]
MTGNDSPTDISSAGIKCKERERITTVAAEKDLIMLHPQKGYRYARRINQHASRSFPSLYRPQSTQYSPPTHSLNPTPTPVTTGKYGESDGYMGRETDKKAPAPRNLMTDSTHIVHSPYSRSVPSIA